ncbi:helix-turn-helix domain-containing protein [Actinomycetospora corticicola]|uniref:helix-turn-helix domain-containing protein n=1 Tax=Actinomycetospora corticicola TaxID=663602 RepID=UPI0015CB6335
MALLLRTTEAARRVGVSQRSLNRWTTAGKLHPTFLTPGGHARWDEADLRRQLGMLRE